MNTTNHSGLHINETIAILAWRENGDQSAARWLTEFHQAGLVDACTRWVSRIEDIQYVVRRATARLLNGLSESTMAAELIIDQAARDAAFEFIGTNESVVGDEDVDLAA